MKFLKSSHRRAILSLQQSGKRSRARSSFSCYQLHDSHGRNGCGKRKSAPGQDENEGREENEKEKGKQIRPGREKGVDRGGEASQDIKRRKRK